MGLAAIALVVIPLYMLSKSGNKAKKNLLTKFKALSGELGLEITEFDAWNDMVLGIDKGARKVLFFKNREGGEEHTVVELEKVIGCKKINVSRNVKSKSELVNVIDVLGLELSFQHGQPPLLLEFYNSKNSFILHEELLLAEKWLKTINGLLKK